MNRRTSRTMLTAALLTAALACSTGSLEGPGPVVEIGISPVAPEVAPGEAVQFTLVGAEAVAWAVDEAGGGTIDAQGRYQAPDQEGTFTVTAELASARKSTPVHVKRNVSPPVIVSFAAAQAELAQGASTTLVWDVTGATSITLEGVGDVTGDGSYTVAPAATTTYTLTATNRAGSVTASAKVTVRGPSQGTGTTYRAAFLTGVTGGGAMPSWTSNVVTAACAGDGVTDDRACLQAAANAARDQRKPLVIPAKASFYRITGPFTVYGSVGGVGGMPTLKQTNASGTWGAGKMMILAAGTTGWIHNLHLVGTFNGSNAVTEHAHQIDVGNVNGVTISGNLLEDAMGDAIGTDVSQYDGGGLSQNVLVDGNTMRNPYRCAVGLIHNQRNWVVTNNVIDKQVNFVSGIDIEPEGGGVVRYVEIAYNRFVMNNRTVNPDRGADGMAVFGWRVPEPPTPTAGGDYWLHHNYGTFGTGFSGFGNGGWGPIYQASNVEGPNVPE